jgi:hypothetical protein
MSATGHDRAYGFSLIATPHAANEQAETTKRRSNSSLGDSRLAALERTKTLRLETEKKRATRAFRQRPKNLRRVSYEHLVCSRPLVGGRSKNARRTRAFSHTNAIEKTASGGAKGAFFSSRRFSARTARRAHATRDAHVERTTDPGHTRSRSIATNVSTDAHANATRAPSPGMKHENSGDEEGAPPAIPIPKRRRTSEKAAPRSTAGKTKKKDAGASEDDINSLFWLVEVRAGSVANAPYPTRARQLDS